MSESDSSSAGAHASDGHGWLAGPYVSARLTPFMYFDARAAWGRSSNSIDPLGSYVDDFETTRSLYSARLTGDWSFGPVLFRPGAELIYFSEIQKAYANANGIEIDSNRVSLGRVTFGPELAYRIHGGGSYAFEPFVGLKGVWDFAKPQLTTAAGEPVAGDVFRGRVEGGATLRSASGISLRASGSYDGFGDGQFRAYEGRAAVVIPLQ